MSRCISEYSSFILVGAPLLSFHFELMERSSVSKRTFFVLAARYTYQPGEILVRREAFCIHVPSFQPKYAVKLVSLVSIGEHLSFSIYQLLLGSPRGTFSMRAATN